jgi:hypothetical protein
VDSVTRRYIKEQINAHARKREGLKAAPVRRAKKQPARSRGLRYTEAQLIERMQACAKDTGIPYDELTVADYNCWREADKTRGPSAQALRLRLPKLALRPKGMS